MRNTERYVVDRARPTIFYGPSRTSTGTARMLSLSTGESRIELGEQPMYDLWTEVRGVPWPSADRGETGRLVHAANHADEEMLLEAASVLEGEMWTLRVFAEFLEDVGAVEDGLAESVRILDLDPGDRSSDTKLSVDAARSLLSHYRPSESDYGTRQHAFLALAWFTGARQGSIRGLDSRDASLDGSPYVMFRHRPDTGTPLKNKLEGERPVALPEPVGDVLRTYIADYR